LFLNFSERTDEFSKALKELAAQVSTVQTLVKEDIERPIKFATENDDKGESIRSTAISQQTIEENKKNETLLSPECVPSKTTDDDQKSGNERDVRTKKEEPGSQSYATISEELEEQYGDDFESDNEETTPSLNCCLLLSPLKMTQE